MVITTYKYSCGCTMSRVGSDEINDVHVTCDEHRKALKEEIKLLASQLSTLLREAASKS